MTILGCCVCLNMFRKVLVVLGVVDMRQLLLIPHFSIISDPTLILSLPSPGNARVYFKKILLPHSNDLTLKISPLNADFRRPS